MTRCLNYKSSIVTNAKSLTGTWVFLFLFLLIGMSQSALGHIAITQSKTVDPSSSVPIHLYYLNGKLLEYYTCEGSVLRPTPEACNQTANIKAPLDLVFDLALEMISEPAKSLEEEIAKLGHEISTTDEKINILLNSQSPTSPDQDPIIAQIRKDILKSEDVLDILISDIANQNNLKTQIEDKIKLNATKELEEELSKLKNKLIEMMAKKDKLLTSLHELRTRLIDLQSQNQSDVILKMLQEQRRINSEAYLELIDQSKDIWHQAEQMLVVKNKLISDITYTYLIPRDQIGSPTYPYDELKNLYKYFFAAYVQYGSINPAPLPPADQAKECDNPNFVKVPRDFSSIQEALTSIIATGGTVCLGRGVYKVPETLNIAMPASGRGMIYLIGQGIDQTIVRINKPKNILHVLFSESTRGVQIQKINLEGTVQISQGDEKHEFNLVESQIRNLVIDEQSNIPGRVSVYRSKLDSMKIVGGTKTPGKSVHIEVVASVIGNQGIHISARPSETEKLFATFLQNTFVGNDTSSTGLSLKNISHLNLVNNLFTSWKLGVELNQIYTSGILSNAFFETSQLVSSPSQYDKTNFFDTLDVELKGAIPTVIEGSALCTSRYFFRHVINTDFFGHPRSPKNPTIGAIECSR
ncbi:MAG: hypothetical protein NT027_16010 [Proteobacteria bacterium]|nr:hypothetical protein [Pseudomonadota bacterium]